jgi:hypothetical protein
MYVLFLHSNQTQESSALKPNKPYIYVVALLVVPSQALLRVHASNVFGLAALRASMHRCTPLSPWLIPSVEAKSPSKLPSFTRQA